MHATVATDWPYLSYPGRLAEPGTFPLAKSKTAPAKQAAKLHAAWVEQHAAVAAVENDLRDAIEAARTAEETLERAFGDLNADRAEVTALRAELDAAMAHASEPWTARYRGAIHAAKAASAAYAAHVDEQFAALLAELEADAAAARDGIVQAARALEDAQQPWRDVNRRVLALVAHATGLNGQDVPTSPGLPVHAADLAAITTENVPLPLPFERSLRERRPDAL